MKQASIVTNENINMRSKIMESKIIVKSIQEMGCSKNFGDNKLLELLSMAVAPVSFPLALGIMAYEIYDVIKDNNEELKNPMPDEWLDKVAKDTNVSEQGLKFLAKKLESKGFVSVQDSYDWLKIEEDITKKEIEKLKKDNLLKGQGAMNLLNRVKGSKEFDISFDKTLEKIKGVKDNLKIDTSCLAGISSDILKNVSTKIFTKKELS